jgi:hypothetical protein
MPVDKGYRHRCFGKIRKIFERTGLVVTHSEVTYMCEHMFHSSGEKEFYDAMDKLSDDQLKDAIHRMRKKRMLGVAGAEEAILAYQ